MIHPARFAAAFALFITAASLEAKNEPASIVWAELPDPSAQQFEDPYRDLTEDQVEQLRIVVQAREELAREATPQQDRPGIESRLTTAIEAFSAADIDVDWLIAQRWVVAQRRERAANAANPAFDGRSVSIAGFAIPAPLDVDGTPTVYLVEVAGQCSHMPPPPPNQMVKVRLESGWTPTFMNQPVRLKGRLHIAPSERVFPIVDGDVAMKATWRLDASDVEELRPAATEVGE